MKKAPAEETPPKEQEEEAAGDFGELEQQDDAKHALVVQAGRQGFAGALASSVEQIGRRALDSSFAAVAASSKGLKKRTLLGGEEDEEEDDSEDEKPVAMKAQPQPMKAMKRAMKSTAQEDVHLDTTRMASTTAKDLEDTEAEEEEEEEKPKKELKREPSDAIVERALQRGRFKDWAKNQIRHEDENGDSAFSETKTQYRKSLVDRNYTLGPKFYGYVERKHMPADHKLAKLKATDSEGDFCVLLQAALGMLVKKNGKHDYGPMKVWLLRNLKRVCTERDLIGLCRGILKLHPLNNQEKIDVVKAMLAHIVKMGLHTQYAAKFDVIKNDVDEFLVGLYNSQVAKKDDPDKAFMDAHGAKLDLICDAEHVKKLLAAKQLGQWTDEVEEILNQTVEATGIGKALFMKEVRKIVVRKVQAILEKHLAKYEALTGDITATYVEDLTAQILEEIDDVPNIAQLEPKRRILVRYRRWHVKVRVKNIVEEVEIRMAAIGKNHALERGKLLGLWDEHGLWGNPLNPNAKGNMDDDILAPWIQARVGANKAKKEHAAIKSGAHMVGFIKENEKDWLADDSTMKLELEAIKQLHTEAGLDMVRHNVMAELPCNVMGMMRFPSPQESWGAIKRIQQSSIMTYVSKEGIAEIENIRKVLDSIVMSEAPDMALVTGNLHLDNVRGSFPLFFLHNGIRGQPGLQGALDAAEAKHQKKENLTPADMEAFTVFAYFMNDKAIAQWKALKVAQVKQSGAAQAVRAGKRKKDAALAKKAQVNKRARARQEKKEEEEEEEDNLMG